MQCKQGEVVLVPFPFTDQTGGKQRPALVASCDWFNSLRPDCVLAAISSQVPATLERDELQIPANDLQSAGLPLPSIVKLGKLFTLERSKIIKRIGLLRGPTLEAALAGIASVLART